MEKMIIGANIVTFSCLLIYIIYLHRVISGNVSIVESLLLLVEYNSNVIDYLTETPEEAEEKIKQPDSDEWTVVHMDDIC